ncbi:MAG: hypothetical protein ACPGTP_08635 [Bacteroidia bacterium]
MFRYLLVGLIIYWIGKRVFKLSDAVKNDGKPKNENPPSGNKTRSTSDKHGGDYVDFEEVD